MHHVYNVALSDACAALAESGAELARARAKLEARLDEHSLELERRGQLTAQDRHLLPRARRAKGAA